MKNFPLFFVQIEDFWRLHNNLKTPCHMDLNSNFHFFKSGINPLWEDVENKNGGKWVFTVRNDLEALSKSWLEVVSSILESSVRSIGIPLLVR